MRFARSILCAVLLASVAVPAPAQSSGTRSGEPVRPTEDQSPRLLILHDWASSDEMREAETPTFWFGVGGGVGGYGLTGQLEAAVKFGSNVVMGRHVGTTDIFANMTETGVLYGRATRSLAFLGGVGVARGNRQHPLNEPGAGPEMPPTLGVALHGQWRFGHWGPAGLALSGLANVNGEHSFAGLTLTIQIGRF